MSHDRNAFVTYDKWEHGQVLYLGDNETHEMYSP
jgi:hypothetical protein